jgi:ribosomal protein S8
MIGQAITLGDISVIVGVIAALAGFWYRMETRVSGAATNALAKAHAVETALHDYKLEVAENYAKNGFIRDVEQRLGERFDKIVDELHGMRTDLQKAMIDMAQQKSGTGRKSS